ncbi:MAG TPA: tyrosine-type recombinase/integrase [Hyphomonas sp.]|nr:tyrosine-type recombinase/integrase [Candidatus Competibacteraceae bacterium]HRX75181.1 tyrosine-type recombinase/integrase [Hyphomonas sp.]
MNPPTIGFIIYHFFLDYLPQQKGLRANSIRSYRDTLRLFLIAVAESTTQRISALRLEHLSFERVSGFLHDLEQVRHNGVSTRNQRLAALHTFFEYVGRQVPEMLHVCEQVAAIPKKRTPLPETHFMTREEIQRLFDQLPEQGRFALRDRALLLFLYNTGARVQEAADLRREHLTFEPKPSVRLHGKGDKWRTCPLWEQTARTLGQLLEEQGTHDPQAPVFSSTRGESLTRFGIYKRVRKHAALIEQDSTAPDARHITPHVFRHSTAVSLLESGAELNIIAGWLGHVSPITTNRYAEITLRMKEEALKLCEPPVEADGRVRKPAWHDDAELMSWLASL